LRRSRKLSGLVLVWKGFCYTLGTAVLAAIAVQLWFLGHIVYWSKVNPSSTAFMEHRLELLRVNDSRAALRREWVPYERISAHL
jgi:monofunctional glycosyltransferase